MGQYGMYKMDVFPAMALGNGLTEKREKIME